MSFDWNNYMAYKKKKVEKKQASLFEFDDVLIKEEAEPVYVNTNLEDFEPVERRPRRELTGQEKLAIELLQYHDRWTTLERPLIVLEKAKINVYIQSLGVEARWAIGYGVYMCALCRVDGIKHKLQKVKYVGQICKECVIKYQTQIQELLKDANYAQKTSRRLRKD